MITKQEYAAIAAAVYKNVRSDFNEPLLPDPWFRVPLPDTLRGSLVSSGFTGAIYVNDAKREVVVAYKGTDFYGGDRLPDTALDLITDLSLVLGSTSTQVQAAAALAGKAAADYASYDLSFTGHSLGGGLASMMAVFFDKPATTFAEAPFESAATNQSNLNAVKAAIQQAGAPELAAKLAIYQSAPRDYLFDREYRVHNYAASEEFLQTSPVIGRSASNAIYGVNDLLNVWKPTGVGDQGADGYPVGLTLHSMTLHAALTMSEDLRLATFIEPQLLASLFDEKLFFADGKEAMPDFLTRMVNRQIATDINGVAGPLAQFATELRKLGNSGTADQKAVNSALIATLIEHYFIRLGVSVGTLPELIQLNGNALNFKYSDIDSSKPLYAFKSLPLLAAAVGKTLSAAEQEYVFNLQRRDAWHIQSGDGAMTFTGSGTDSNAIIGGGGADIMDGGADADILVGGEGDDVLAGDSDDTPVSQQGNDQLYGGDGGDILRGYGGVAVLDGGTGDDRLFGGAGNDALVGDDGDDVLSGNEDNDTLYGEAGRDTMDGGAVIDTDISKASSITGAADRRKVVGEAHQCLIYVKACDLSTKCGADQALVTNDAFWRIAA